MQKSILISHQLELSSLTSQGTEQSWSLSNYYFLNTIKNCFIVVVFFELWYDMYYENSHAIMYSGGI